MIYLNKEEWKGKLESSNAKRPGIYFSQILWLEDVWEKFWCREQSGSCGIGETYK